MTIAAALAMVLAMVAAACGNKADTSGGGGGQAANWPQRDLRIMAPADPGGGWDTTARVMSQAMTQSKAVDKGIEVYNVPGAGGTIGLSQLSSKQAGKSNQLMVMGLVMMGAIETNKSPVDLSKTTPIAALTTEPEAILVRADSKYKTLQGPARRHEGRPGEELVRWRLGRRHRPDPARAGRQGRGRRSLEAQVRRVLRRR